MAEIQRGMPPAGGASIGRRQLTAAGDRRLAGVARKHATSDQTRWGVAQNEEEGKGVLTAGLSVVEGDPRAVGDREEGRRRLKLGAAADSDERSFERLRKTTPESPRHLRRKKRGQWWLDMAKLSR